MAHFNYFTLFLLPSLFFSFNSIHNITKFQLKKNEIKGSGGDYKNLMESFKKFKYTSLDGKKRSLNKIEKKLN